MENFDIKEHLESFGLTNTEGIVFSELYNLGPATIGKIIEKTRLHRGTVYNTIQRLIHKGIIQIARNRNTILYEISPVAFISDIQEQKKEIKKREDMLKSFLDNLKKTKSYNLQNKDRQEGELHYLYGTNSYKNVIFKTLKELQNNSDSYMYIGPPGSTYDYISEDFEMIIQQLKAKLRIVSKAIFMGDNKKHPFFSMIRCEKVRWLNDKLWGKKALWLWNGKALMADFNVQPMKLVYIEDKNIEQSYNDMFKSIWENPKSISHEEVYN